jgi:hypothetical protein
MLEGFIPQGLLVVRGKVNVEKERQRARNTGGSGEEVLVPQRRSEIKLGAP